MQRPTKKKCSTCQNWLSLDQFPKDASNKDGLRYSCKPCRSAYDRFHRKHYPKHYSSRSREARREYRKRYVQKTKRNRKESDAKYRKAHVEKIKIRGVTYKKYRQPQTCAIRNCISTGERHHLSYDTPDNFIWLCHEHHLEAHLEL